ncbi:MAG: hypothetical protein IPK62_02770 [Bacteroidetes bacterium]|nr:hypothetical protein [Bacteroidota bacterium]MBK8143990.1 hypothetical protein [Bacteroidota bacterium]MBP6314585.1 hypothetical protein [Chitinophagaceae bacterium]
MNKFILILLLLTGFTLSLSAQFFSAPKWDYLWDQKAHEKGQIHFSYGYGQPRLDKKLFDYQKDSIDFRVIGVGPFFWKAELGLTRKLSVMLSAGYILYKADWKVMRPDPLYTFDLPFVYGTQLHDISANLRFNYHIFVNKEFDVYVGGGVGYNHFMNKDFTDYAPDDTLFKSQFKLPYPVSYEMTFGVRYFFLTRTAIYVEAGIGKSLLQGGFVFKFRHRKRL